MRVERDSSPTHNGSDNVTKKERPALIIATFFENTKELLNLLEKGVDINETDANGWTALSMAGIQCD